jgi:hypothetical protein
MVAPLPDTIMREPTSEKQNPLSLYEVLQVSPRAEARVIQAAYRVLARDYHPDVSRDTDAAERMRRLNAAYEVLRDRELRAQYDARRARAAHGPTRYRPVRSARQDFAPVRSTPSNWGQGPVAPIVWALIGGAIVVFVAILTLGVWFFVTEDDRPPRVSQAPAGMLMTAARWTRPEAR